MSEQPHDTALSRRRAVALDAAWNAGILCSAAFGAPRAVKRKGHLDVVTETDSAVEHDIISRLRAAFPDDKIIGEESTGNEGEDALTGPGFCWLLDPICGTSNFAQDLPPLYCTNIALLLDGAPILSVVAEGGRPNEILYATRGEGAWAINSGRERQLHVLGTSEIVALDLGYAPTWNQTERPARIAAELIRRNRFSLRVLSSSVTFPQQARGALAGNIMEKVMPWDITAGALLLSEAGAAVTDLHGHPWSVTGSGLISGSTPEIHAELVESVAAACADIVGAAI